METREEAIAWLTARGYWACEWDTYAPNAFGVATAAEVFDLDGEETTRVLGKTVMVCPSGGSWEVRSILGEPPTDSFATLTFVTLKQAVMAAADVVSG